MLLVVALITAPCNGTPLFTKLQAITYMTFVVILARLDDEYAYCDNTRGDQITKIVAEIMTFK